MKRLAFLTGAVVASILGSAVTAHEFKVGDLTIEHPYALATPRTAKSAAGYFSITNDGDTPDRLMGVESDPMGMLHETTTDANGVARMGEVEGIEIAPGQTLTLKPRGIHVMFMGLTKPFLVGETIPAKLVFEKAGVVDVVFNVQSRAESAADQDASHEGMDHPPTQ